MSKLCDFMACPAPPTNRLQIKCGADPPEIRVLLVGLLALPLLADPHSLGLDFRQLVRFLVYASSWLHWVWSL